MTVTEALEKLKTYEQTSFALGHAMGLLYYDGVTVAPKGAAAVRGDTSAELSRIDYQLTTAPETVEMLETLMAAREELDAVMEPKLYIGRCKQQVERFLDECEPLLRDAAAADGQISL